MPSSNDKEKIPLSKVKKMPYKALKRLLDKMRAHLKENEVMRKIFSARNLDIEEIDLIPMMFGDLDVSAKTDHGVIILSYELLTDGDFVKDFSYGIHEIVHYIDRTSGAEATKSSNDGEYLDNPYEQKAFSKQVEYIAGQQGEDEAEKYVDNLLEHHEKDGKEADKLKKVLMKQID